MTVLTIKKATGHHPLFCQYEGQYSPQPAYLELDPENRTLQADYSAEIGDAVSAAEFHHRIRTFGINPKMKTSIINRLMSEVAPLAMTVCDGYEEIWDGNNFVGTYTKQAEEACWEIQQICEEYDIPEYLDMRV